MKDKRGRGGGERRGPKGGSGMDDLKLIQSDPRFAHMTSDPKFQHISKKKRKVKLDSRFHSILTDDKFYEKSTMDPRGRKGNYSTKEDLLRFYHLSSDEDSEEEEEEEDSKEEEDSEEEEEEEKVVSKIKTSSDSKVKTKLKKTKVSLKEDEEEEEQDQEEEEEVDKKKKKKKKEKSKDNIVEDKTNTNEEEEDKKTKKKKKTKDEQEEEEEEEEEDEDKKKQMKKTKDEQEQEEDKKKTKNEQEQEEQQDTTARDKEERSLVTQEITERLQDFTRDYARGGGDLFSSDSSDDDSSTTEEEEEEEFEWGELDQDAVWDNEAEVEETKRIAICNLDWDRIKAADLMVLFSSFCPLGGSVKSVAIYPSEYGRSRLAEEDRCGPPELTTVAPNLKKGMKEEEEEEDVSNLVDLDKLEKGKLDENTGATRHHFEALRRYQRNRLRYFYAVMECDNVDTARTIYHECDRQPFEGAGIILDLRYVPSDMEFEETPHDLCQAVPRSYKAKDFVTTALQNTRPALTWDETDPERYKTLTSAMSKAMKGGTLDEDGLKDFLASSSEEEEENEEEDEGREDNNTSDDDEESEEVKTEKIAKFRALIREIDDKEKKKKEREIDMEDTFDDNREEGKEDDEGEEDKDVEGLTPFQQYLEKRKAKRKERKKRQKENKKKDDNGESDGSISDDDGMEDLYSDPFFAQEMKNMKKKGITKKKMSKDDSDEDDGDEKGNLELLLMDEDKEDRKHFNMREIIKNSETNTKKGRKNKIKKKMIEKQKEQKNKAVDDFKVNVSDPRFSHLLTSGEYNIDPSHPQFKRTHAMDGLIGEIQRKRVAESGEEVPGAKRPCPDTKHRELTSLVQRVKRKTGKIKSNKTTTTTT